MALHFTLMLNDTPIGTLYAQRLNASAPELPDTIYTYRWELRSEGPYRFQRGTGLEHRYGDGAWALIMKVIAAAALQ